MGIDIGATGISAALLNAKTRQLYPITWSAGKQMNATEPLFRLPGVVNLQVSEHGEPAFLMALETTEVDGGIWLKNLKSYLKVSLPTYIAETDTWEPFLQWSEQQTVCLDWVRQAMQTLLTTLNLKAPQQGSATASAIVYDLLPVQVVGLESQSLSAVLDELAGIIISNPADWPETYRFNIREAVLATGLVESPEQICFVEEAIASLLTELQTGETDLQGSTLIVHAGAATTELALVDLPTNRAQLTYSDFDLRSFTYAGNAIDQDIICQLLLSPEYETRFPLRNELELPSPGEPDLTRRYRLQQRLESSAFGQTLLEAAKHLKLTLQQQDSATLELESHRWVLRQQDLENWVFAPFVQALNRELNILLVRQGISVEGIRQVIFTGGTARIGAIAQWLRQKLPNAKQIVDCSNDPKHQYCGVAFGLASLPLYPLVLDAATHQYSDYFLLQELLSIFSEQPLSIGKIVQMLERRGINTSACNQRIFAFLEGQLPPGMVPQQPDDLWLTQASQQNPHSQELAAIQLFNKEDNQTYRLHLAARDRLYRYLDTVLARTRQKFAEPNAIYWVTPPTIPDRL